MLILHRILKVPIPKKIMSDTTGDTASDRVRPTGQGIAESPSVFLGCPGLLACPASFPVNKALSMRELGRTSRRTSPSVQNMTRNHVINCGRFIWKFLNMQRSRKFYFCGEHGFILTLLLFRVI